MFTQLEALKLDMNKLRGQIEVLNNNVENTAKRQRDMYLDLDTRVRRFEQQGACAGICACPPQAPARSAPVTRARWLQLRCRDRLPPAHRRQTGAGRPPAVAVTTVDSGAETRAYEAAQGQRRIGNYQGAIVAFQNFIKQHPKSNLAPRAQYWIGDSYFNLRDFKLAIASQQALIKTYPDSPTVPDAMLNIASSQIEMGESNAGRKTLEDLVAKYPVSEAAEKAKRRIAAFNAPGSVAPPSAAAGTAAFRLFAFFCGFHKGLLGGPVRLCPPPAPPSSRMFFGGRLTPLLLWRFRGGVSGPRQSVDQVPARYSTGAARTAAARVRGDRGAR